MSNKPLVLEVLEKYYSSLKLNADALAPLFIADMDSVGRNSSGLGWNEIGDDMRPVPMMARLPEVVRPGDEIYLYWTDTPPTWPIKEIPKEPAVQHYILDEATVKRGWLSFAITRPALNLPVNLPDRHPYTGYFYYALEDADNKLRSYSEARKVLIDLGVPGGLDPDLKTPVNANLEAPTVTPVEVTPGTNVKMTLAPWEFQQSGDQVTVIWNGVRYVDPRRLQAADVGKNFVIDVPKEVIEKGDDGEKVPVQYEIRDLVQNYSRPSPPAYANVRLDPNTLKAPDVMGADDPPYELNLDWLNNNNVNVAVPNGIEKGVTLVMFWIGMTRDGQEVPYTSPPRTYNNSFDLIFDVPNAYARFLTGGTARVFYTVTSATGTPRPSLTRYLRIVGGVSTLRPPIVVEAVDDFIDLVDVPGSNFHVRIPLYPGQMAGDQIIVTLVGRPPSGVPLVTMAERVVPANGEGVEQVLPITAEYLRLLLNGTLSLGYTVFTPSLNITRRSVDDPRYDVEDSRVSMYPALTSAQVKHGGDGAFLPSNTEVAQFVVPETAPLVKGRLITFRFGVAGKETPPPVTRSVVFSQFPLSFAVSADNIRPFEGLDVQATYSVSR
ncbi:TPA: hypothetical protein ACKP22_004469 [Pseudomonas putida]